MRILHLTLALLTLSGTAALALDKPSVVYKIFQFPADKIPRIDGNTEDWSIVPASYVVGMDQLADSLNGIKADPKDLTVSVRVGWVKGLNRLYFLYEAYDNYWDFSRQDLHNDMFEVVIDADRSGGPFIRDLHPAKNLSPWEIYRNVQGVHAQNWHIFTPPGDKDWAMVWGCQQPWIRELPYANSAYSYNFKPGQSGRLTLEFWITPFDHASCDGPHHSIESQLVENKLLGMAWAVKDHDDVNAKERAFWNLSPNILMYGDASHLVSFQLMPLEPKLQIPLQAQWSFQLLHPDARSVAFRDHSHGPVTTWKWEFGDGLTSPEQHPIHTYAKEGEYIVTLTVDGPEGTSRKTKVWDIVLK